MSGSDYSDDFEQINNDFARIEPPVSIKVRQEILTMQQNEKSAYLFGTVNQSGFYKFLKQNPQFKVESKFQQSGPRGFLPMGDPGVCGFMSQDFAQAVIEGRYKTWKEKISSLDKSFIDRLREGQYADMKGLKLGVKDRNFGPAYEKRVKGDYLPVGQDTPFDANVLANNIHNKINASTDAQSLLNRPCIELHVRLARLGLAGRLINKPFTHSMMFTQAVDEKGQLDKKHLFFMDANCGIIKIPNDEESIKLFLNGINSKLFSSMKIIQSGLNKYEHVSLSEPDPQKKATLIEKIQNNQIAHNEQDYALCKLCRLDNFLQGQIARLECKSVSERLFGKKDNIREEKINFLSNIRTNLHTALKDLDKLPESKKELFDEILKKLDNPLLEQQRGTIKSKLATTAAEFKKFKEQFANKLEDIKKPDHSEEQGPSPPRRK